MVLEVFVGYYCAESVFPNFERIFGVRPTGSCTKSISDFFYNNFFTNDE